MHSLSLLIHTHKRSIYFSYFVFSFCGPFYFLYYLIIIERLFISLSLFFLFLFLSSPLFSFYYIHTHGHHKLFAVPPRCVFHVVTMNTMAAAVCSWWWYYRVKKILVWAVLSSHSSVALHTSRPVCIYLYKRASPGNWNSAFEPLGTIWWTVAIPRLVV